MLPQRLSKLKINQITQAELKEQRRNEDRVAIIWIKLKKQNGVHECRNILYMLRKTR